MHDDRTQPDMRDEAILNRLRSVPPRTVSHDLAPDILRRIRAEGAAAPRRLPAWRRTVAWPLAAAAALVLILAGNWVVPRLIAKRNLATMSVRERASDWLCRTQEPDGSWSTARWGGHPKFEVALTALAALTLLDESMAGASDPRRGAALGRALRWLVERQGAAGGFGPEFDGAPYNQGLATLALAQAMRQADRPDLKPVLERAVMAIRRLQHADGGWGYAGEVRPMSNLSITLWQLEALRAAREAGVEGDGISLDRGLRWMAGMAADDGSFGYQRRGDTPTEAGTLTAMGAMSLLDRRHAAFLPPARRTAIGAQVLREARRQGPDTDYYRRYFLAAALRVMEAPEAEGCLGQLRRTLASGQVANGHERGSWAADTRWGSAGGRVYATTLAALASRE
jgi:prenyltransferase beta subunit